MKMVTILSGASGSGKSTWADEWEDKRPIQVPARIVSADDHFKRNGGYDFNPAELPEAHRQCLLRFVEALQSERPWIIVDNTNTTVAEIAPFYALAQAYGYDVVIKCFTGRFRNIHDVPPTVVEKQRLRAQNLILEAPPWWQFEFETTWPE